MINNTLLLLSGKRLKSKASLNLILLYASIQKFCVKGEY